MTVSTEHQADLRVPGVIDALAQESRLRRIATLALTGAMAVVFFYVILGYWVPVHQGVDQNGYLVGGKFIAEYGSMAYQPRRLGSGEIDPFQFVGRMWVGFDLGTPNERYLPKYPVGLPLIYAGAMKIGGPERGVVLAYLVSPIAMALSLIGVHLLARLLLGSVPAFGVALLVATSPVALSCTNNPNSHATSLVLVIWGMYLLVRWWLHGGMWAAILSGLLIGSAVSIRYTEGMLILPIALVAMFRLRQVGWRDGRAWGQSVALGLAWAAPVVALAWHNRVAMGAWTGYDPTNESTGFAWKYFVQNWDTMLRLMYQTGMTLVFPLAVAGLAAGFVWNWRVATFLASWVVPCLLLYTAYYWAPEGLTIGYTRFFLTIFPALGICAFGLLLWPASHLPAADEVIRRRLKYGGAAGLVMIAATSIPLGIANIHQSMVADYTSRLNLRYRSSTVLSQVPAGSVLFSDDVSLLHHIQMASDYVLYSPEVFMRAMLDRMGERNPDEPNGLDPGRAQYLMHVVGDKKQADLDGMRDGIILGAISAGRRVFVFTQGNQPNWAMGPARPRGGAGIRPPGWRGFSSQKLSLVPLISGTDPEAMPRNNPLARWGLAQPGRDRNPTTMPKAQWQIYEVVPKAN